MLHCSFKPGLWGNNPASRRGADPRLLSSAALSGNSMMGGFMNGKSNVHKDFVRRVASG